MKTRRRHERFIKRLEVEFSAGDQTNRGISSNFSLGGLFIRTNRVYTPGTHMDLTIHFPDGRTSKAKGVVKMARKTPVALKNGMGIEVTCKDSHYEEFMRSFGQEAPEPSIEPPETPQPSHPGPHAHPHSHHHPSSHKQTPPPSDSIIITCPLCGIKNRVNLARLSVAKCGKCGAALRPSE